MSDTTSASVVVAMMEQQAKEKAAAAASAVDTAIVAPIEKAVDTAKGHVVAEAVIVKNDAVKEADKVDAIAESFFKKAEDEVKTVATDVKKDVEVVAKDVKADAIKVVDKLESKIPAPIITVAKDVESVAMTTAQKVATLIKTHTDALNVAKASLDEANRIFNAAKSDAQKVMADAQKARAEAEIYVAATEGVIKHVFAKIRSWF